MPRIYLEGQVKEPDTTIDIEMIWNNIEDYRGNQEVLKLLFKDGNKPTYDYVTNGKYVVTRNIQGRKNKVLFYLYTIQSFINLLDNHNSPIKEQLLDKINRVK